MIEARRGLELVTAVGGPCLRSGDLCHILAVANVFLIYIFSSIPIRISPSSPARFRPRCLEVPTPAAHKSCRGYLCNDKLVAHRSKARGGGSAVRGMSNPMPFVIPSAHLIYLSLVICMEALPYDMYLVLRDGREYTSCKEAPALLSRSFNIGGK